MSDRKFSNLTKFTGLCHAINFKDLDDLFVKSSKEGFCSVCEYVCLGNDVSVVVHMYLLLPSDKLCVHGEGLNFFAAKENAAKNACILLESLDAEIFSLRKQRLRVRLSDFGVSVPISSAMQILKDENEDAPGDNGPFGFDDLVVMLTRYQKKRSDSALDDESPPRVYSEEEVISVSETFLLAIPRYTREDIVCVVSKLGLTLCDELCLSFNPFLFSSLISLLLRIDAQNMDEKITLAFCKLLEQVLILHAPDPKIVGRLIRTYVSARSVPFMSRNRFETIAIQLSKGGVECVLNLERDIEKHATEDDAALLEIVNNKSPKPEYLKSLATEFQKVNLIIKSLFGVDGQIYGSLVNGFPTNSSDIDVVVNLPIKEQTIDEIYGLADDENDDEKNDKRNIAELNLLFDALSSELDEWTVSKIETARVPILVCKKVGIEVNISFNHQVVLENSALLRAYSAISPRVNQLVVLVKHWAKQREVNDSLQGTLSSYSFVLLVISYLQCINLLPNLQSENAPQRLVDGGKCVVYFESESSPNFENLVAPFRKRLDQISLKKLFVQFFEHYLWKVCYITDVVSIGGWADKPILKKKDLFLDEAGQMDIRLYRRRTWFTIADPFETGRYLGTSARGTENLVKEMIRATELIMNGEFKDLFKQYNRGDRTQLPPFPLRELNKHDPVQFSFGTMRTRFDPTEEIPDWLKNQLLKKNIHTQRNIFYWQKRGLPTVADLDHGQAQAQGNTSTFTQARVQAHTRAHAHTQVHARAHPGAHLLAHVQGHTGASAQVHAHTQAHAQGHTGASAQVHAHTQAHAQGHTPARAQGHTKGHTIAQPHAHGQTHPQPHTQENFGASTQGHTSEQKQGRKKGHKGAPTQGHSQGQAQAHTQTSAQTHAHTNGPTSAPTQGHTQGQTSAHTDTRRQAETVRSNTNPQTRGPRRHTRLGKNAPQVTEET